MSDLIGNDGILMLTLDDAVKVTKRLIRDDITDVDIIRQELEQKCWFPPKADEAANHLNNLILRRYVVGLSQTISENGAASCRPK